MISSSNLVLALESAWNDIQLYNSDVPDVMLLVGSGGRSLNKYGHFAANSWANGEDDLHEVLLVAEHLKRPAREVFTTLAHEAVHGLNHQRDIKDVSGKRHNKKFAFACPELLLEAPASADRTLGYSNATLSPLGEEEFDHTINMLDECLIAYRKVKLKDKEPNKTLWKAICNCGREIRLGRKMIKDADEYNSRIRCIDCDSNFDIEEWEEL